MRVAASKVGSSSLRASAHVWNADCTSVLSQVSAENIGPLYIGKARTAIKLTNSWAASRLNIFWTVIGVNIC
jgi:hypothetical protein